MSLDAKKKRTLIIGVIAVVVMVGVGWALTSTGDSATTRVVERPVTQDSADDGSLEAQDVAVRSAPQSQSARGRLEGAPAAGADQADDAVAAVEKKTKRNKKNRRRKAQRKQDDDEEEALAPGKAPHPPYGK